MERMEQFLEWMFECNGPHVLKFREKAVSPSSAGGRDSSEYFPSLLDLSFRHT